MTEQKDRLVAAIADMNEEDALALARGMLDGGYDALALMGHCREAMDIVGKRFEEGEYFLPELMMAGEMLEQISAMAKPLIKQQPGETTQRRGTVVIGTVAGDLHDIGKNIVTFMLDVNGFDVVDLGVDVAAQTFIDAIREKKPTVVGLSGFLTLAFDSMRDTIEAIRAAGLRDSVKIMIGGGQIDEAVRKFTGSDAFGANAVAAVSLCQQWCA